MQKRKERRKTKPNEEQQVKLNRELTDIEKMLMKPPGKYAGKNYDEAKVKRNSINFQKI